MRCGRMPICWREGLEGPDGTIARCVTKTKGPFADDVYCSSRADVSSNRLTLTHNLKRSLPGTAQVPAHGCHKIAAQTPRQNPDVSQSSAKLSGINLTIKRHLNRLGRKDMSVKAQKRVMGFVFFVGLVLLFLAKWHAQNSVPFHL